MFRIGIVGAGIIAQGHSEAIDAHSECIVCAVSDIDIEKAKAFGEKHNAPYFTDYKEMAEKVEMDAVILNLPHFLHCEVSVYFLEKGINVLVEKPMANTVEECDRMIAAAKKSGAKLAVGHVQRYYGAVRKAKEIIESGKFGKLCMIREIRNVNYVNPNRPKWFLKKALAGGGIAMNYGAHSIDRIFYTTGLSVEKVHSVTSNPISDDDIDVNVQILLELSGGASATVTYCGCHVPGEYETAFYFTDGVVKVAGGSRLIVYENGEWVNYGGEEANLLEPQLVEFVKFLKGEESEVVSPEYGREVIKVIEQIV